MTITSLLLVVALANLDLDMVNVPLSSEIRFGLAPVGRGDLKREGTVTRVKLEIERVAAPSVQGTAFNTFVVWAVSPEGIFENLGELDVSGNKGQFTATTRLTQFGILVSAEPHYMVDRPSASIVYRSQAAKDDVRRKSARIEVGAYDYAPLKQETAPGTHPTITQARAAYRIAQAVGADHLAGDDFRNAQVAMGALEELVNRGAPLDILWPTANEAIRWSQRAAASARQRK
jgi:hypothetical protein